MDGAEFIDGSARIAILAGAFGSLLLLEFALPLRRAGRSRARRYAVNGAITLSAFAVGSALVRPLGLGVGTWVEGQGFGLLQSVETTFPVKLIAGFLLMDLTFYYWHRANHTVPFLSRFHVVHHIDPDLDVTSSFRFHFGEIFFSAGFRIVQVLFLGISPLTYIVYEFVFTLATLFHHSNVRIPLGLERVLNKVIVTPRMHGIHHSSVLEERNSNYSVVFRWWDWLHSSLVLNRPQSALTIGVKGFEAESDNGLKSLLARPFLRAKRGDPGAANQVPGSRADLEPLEIMVE
ncbi:MAG: sterol desaturase family protein [Planctomycetota bacterium]|jgi:sterol desaturase/sphingolipid hydroxylase (fatty acid hydroxylase superfamily)